VDIVRRPTPEEAAALTVSGLLQRVRQHPYFSLERPATGAELTAGEAAWGSTARTPATCGGPPRRRSDASSARPTTTSSATTLRRGAGWWWTGSTGPGTPLEEFTTLEELLVDRMFLYLDEG